MLRPSHFSHRPTFWRKVLGLAGPLALLACATTSPAVAPADLPARNEHAVTEQLRGHLSRVRSCLAPRASALLDTRFVLQPSGRVTHVEVLRNTSGSGRTALCVKRKIAALYFDPAPTRPRVETHRFAFCDPSDPRLCRLGPPTGPDARPVDRRFAERLRPLADAILACRNERSPTSRALFSIGVTIGRDGSVQSGWLHHHEAEDPALVDCAVRPLLGLPILDHAQDEPRTARFTLALPPPDRIAPGAPEALPQR